MEEEEREGQTSGKGEKSFSKMEMPCVGRTWLTR